MGQVGENYDIWLEGFERQEFPTLATDLNVDVAIVGGGITGVVTAYLLTKAGRSVALVEKGRLGEWTTDCTTAFLTQIIDTHYRDLVSIWGEAKAKQVAQSHGEAINLIETLVANEKIDCDFQRTKINLIARSEKDSLWLKKEVETIRRLGLDAQFLDESSGLAPFGILEVADQATYQPMKFLNALAQRAEALGAKIFEQAEALSLTGGAGSWQVATPQGLIRAKEVVVATYAPWGEPWHLFFRKAMYRSYVYEFSAPANVWPTGLYADLQSPYNYFKIDNYSDRARIIFGGADHRQDLKIDRSKCYEALKDSAREIFTGVEIKEKRRWQGQILESIDGLAYIGRDARSQVWRAFGFSGNGLTYSIITGALLTELITGQTGSFGQYQDLYGVNRWPSFISLLIKGRDYGRILLGGFIKNLWS